MEGTAWAKAPRLEMVWWLDKLAKTAALGKDRCRGDRGQITEFFPDHVHDCVPDLVPPEASVKERGGQEHKSTHLCKKE